jgi:transposase-like protein
LASASSRDRLQAVWQAVYEAWKRRPSRELEVVYLWVDGLYLKAGLEKDRAAVLVAVAALRDGRQVVLAVEAGQRESTAAGSAILQDLKARGPNCPRTVVGDGHLGIWGALANVFPEAQEQRCWNHRVVNFVDKLPQKDQAAAKEPLTVIPYAPTREEAERQKKEFQAWSAQRGQAEVGRLLEPVMHLESGFLGVFGWRRPQESQFPPSKPTKPRRTRHQSA